MGVIIKGRSIKVWMYLNIVYMILLATVVLYTKSVLNTDSFVATEKSTPRDVKEAHAVTVKLSFELNMDQKSYQAELKNQDTVEDLLSYLRNKQGLVYEKTLYTYGTGIDSVFDQLPPLGSEWTVMFNGKNITKDISKTYLINGGTYTLLVSKSDDGIEL